jgi:hypothetical protein
MVTRRAVSGAGPRESERWTSEGHRRPGSPRRRQLKAPTDRRREKPALGGWPAASGSPRRRGDYGDRRSDHESPPVSGEAASGSTSAEMAMTPGRPPAPPRCHEGAASGAKPLPQGRSPRLGTPATVLNRWASVKLPHGDVHQQIPVRPSKRPGGKRPGRPGASNAAGCGECQTPTSSNRARRASGLRPGENKPAASSGSLAARTGAAQLLSVVHPHLRMTS